MPKTIFAGEALGHRRMRASAKEEVIAYLAAADVPPVRRRRWFREWCKATFTKLRPEDLARCAPGKPAEVQLGLLDAEARTKRPAAKTATGADAPVTASTSVE